MVSRSATGREGLSARSPMWVWNLGKVYYLAVVSGAAYIFVIHDHHPLRNAIPRFRVVDPASGFAIRALDSFPPLLSHQQIAKAMEGDAALERASIAAQRTFYRISTLTLTPHRHLQGHRLAQNKKSAQT